METELGFDILQPIPLEEWLQLRTPLEVEWPKYAFYYYWIWNSYLWKKQAPHLQLQIYAPRGKCRDDVTFVGISNFSVWSVVVFTKEASGKRLREAIVNTKRIDWSKQIAFTAVHEYIEPILLSALEILRINRVCEIREYVSGCFRIKSAEGCANLEVKVPKECYIGDMKASHLPAVNSIWPHRDKAEPENSIKFLRAMLMFNRSVGLFLKEGDLPVSWGFCNDWHAIGVVQTSEAYKRRGYAKVVVNALAKQLGEAGISPLPFVVAGNTGSENMFNLLNWERGDPASWIITNPVSEASIN